MMRGFVRLGVVLGFVIWAGVAVFQARHLEQNKWLIEGHISPYLLKPGQDILLSEHFWPVYAATPRFIEMSEQNRMVAASEFYEKQIKMLEGEYFMGHGDEFKRWMIETARLDKRDAPIFEMRGILFRNFKVPGIPIAPRISYCLFGENVLLLTALIIGCALFFILGCTFAIRWVYRGFRAKTISQ